MTTIKTVAIKDLAIGAAYNAVRHTNDAGQAIRDIRSGDWRAVLLTAENWDRYTDGSYYLQPIKCRYTPRLLAAGWTRLSRRKNECGMEITTRGDLFGLACSKGGNWVNMNVHGGHGMCAQHAAQQLP